MDEYIFYEKDIERIVGKGFTEKDINNQINMIIKGVIYPNLIRPATLDDGIIKVSKRNEKKYIELYERRKNNLKIVKFIPASGAASRMFSKLLSYYNSEGEKENSYVNSFIEGLKEGKFAFKTDLKFSMESGGFDLDETIKNRDFLIVLKYILTDIGLNYAKLPKALLKFHKYEDEERTPIDEHIKEGIDYATGMDKVELHFTVSSEHKDKILDYIKYIDFEKYTKTVYITLSEQKEKTETVALNDKNELFRKNNGEILFRPGGHGALIENLNDIEADLIFIKNIDNVAVEKISGIGNNYKKLLAGYLLDVKEKCSDYFEKIKTEKNDVLIHEIKEFIENKLNNSLPDNFDNLTLDSKKNILIDELLKPIRVCGIVKNEGEPGGGPFFVKKNGRTSLQIIEGASVNTNDEKQKAIFSKAEFFNPVDIVCSTVDYIGNKFDLKDFIDENAFFISEKSYDGKLLKALELPGLWNGAMANWITIFIEVPDITFNPVKTVNDLLKVSHLNYKN